MARATKVTLEEIRRVEGKGGRVVGAAEAEGTRREVAEARGMGARRATMRPAPCAPRTAVPRTRPPQQQWRLHEAQRPRRRLQRRLCCHSLLLKQIWIFPHLINKSFLSAFYNCWLLKTFRFLLIIEKCKLMRTSNYKINVIIHDANLPLWGLVLGRCAALTTSPPLKQSGQEQSTMRNTQLSQQASKSERRVIILLLPSLHLTESHDMSSITFWKPRRFVCALESTHSL